MSAVLHEIDGPLARVTLNRPDVLNAINNELLEGLADTLDHVNSLPDVRVVLLSGTGRAFCAGDDLTELNSGAEIEVEPAYLVARLQDISRSMMFSDKIYLVCVQGWAIGGGLSWVLNADLAIVERTAGGFFPEIGLGLFMSGAVTTLLPERIGHPKAMRLFTSGEKVTGEDMERMGLASHLAETGKAAAMVETVASDLLALSPDLLKAVKRVYTDTGRSVIEAALKEETATLTRALEAVEKVRIAPQNS
ncbi:enoyl-CoA hydratase/isomerase family protein [Henriciella litoralis]|uniref:enoyl-CoA hydratase/isomerase family protein n=1 Tax=Henriciella litoralis TaxID=568102 RepID=UPI000A02D3EB|nr:enoyl-CoA hydratase/isomerase family protein [Henriciella litoralis]